MIRIVLSFLAERILPAVMTTANETGSGNNGLLSMRRLMVSFTIRLACYVALIVLVVGVGSLLVIAVALMFALQLMP